MLAVKLALWDPTKHPSKILHLPNCNCFFCVFYSSHLLFPVIKDQFICIPPRCIWIESFLCYFVYHYSSITSLIHLNTWIVICICILCITMLNYFLYCLCHRYGLPRPMYYHLNHMISISGWNKDMSSSEESEFSDDASESQVKH